MAPGDGDATFTTTPSVLFEVASPSSELMDHTEKAAEYQAIASIQHYVVIEQNRPAATLWSRDGEAWSKEPIGADQILGLPAIRLSIPLAELYEGVLFAAALGHSGRSSFHPLLFPRRHPEQLAKRNPERRPAQARRDDRGVGSS